MIISFLATQDLEFAELWIWSPPGLDVSEDALMRPFANLMSVRFKVWDAAVEAAGTELALHPGLINQAHDSKFWLDTDLLRILALGKYGGVYIDMDVLLLRDFGPLLHSEWFYQWGTDCRFSNGAVMRLQRGSPLFGRLLSVLIKTPPAPGSTAWGRECYLQAEPFTRLPCCFFNSLWIGSESPDAGFNAQPHQSRWYGAFAFHLHGMVFKAGPAADPASEYVQAKREIFSRLRERAKETSEASQHFRRRGAGQLAGLDERLLAALQTPFLLQAAQ